MIKQGRSTRRYIAGSIILRFKVSQLMRRCRKCDEEKDEKNKRFQQELQ